MKKLILITLCLIFSTNLLFADKGKIRIASDVSGAYIYVNDKKKAMTGEGFTSILLEEGEYTIKVVKPINEKYEYASTKKVFVGADTSAKLNFKLKKVLTPKGEAEKKAKEATRWSRKGNIVTDNVKKLMWQDEPYTEKEKIAYKKRKAHGKVGNWKYAVKYCKDLKFGGYNNWRLPNKEELLSIVDKKRIPIIKRVFKNIVGKGYWSSSTISAIYPSGALFVYFGNGGNGRSGWNDKVYPLYIRCVRDNK